MQKLLRRVRGAIGMGLTWAVACGLLGGIPRWVLGMESDLPFPILFAGLGFIGGVLFSATLLLIERKRSCDQLSVPRFAAYGAAGGLLMSALFVRGAGYTLEGIAAISATFAIASSVCASGSLLLARRAAASQLGTSEAVAALERESEEVRRLISR